MNTSAPSIAPLPRLPLPAALGLPLLAAIAAGCFAYVRSGQLCVTTALAVCAGALAFLVLQTRLYRKQYSTHAAQLDTNEQAFMRALDQATHGMALVSADGKWIEVNRAMCRILGYSAAELRKIDFQTITYPDDLDADMRFVQQVLDRKIETYSMEKRYIRKDGSLLWCLLTVSAMWDPEGNFRYFISQVEDINDKKLLQEKLRTAEAKLRQQ